MADNGKQNHRGSNITMLGLLAIVALVAGTVYSSKSSLGERERAYIEKEESLLREIAEEEERTSELQEQKKYVTTNQYIKEVARDRLGLLSPDEVILKSKD